MTILTNIYNMGNTKPAECGSWDLCWPLPGPSPTPTRCSCWLTPPTGGARTGGPCPVTRTSRVSGQQPDIFVQEAYSSNSEPELSGPDFINIMCSQKRLGQFRLLVIRLLILPHVTFQGGKVFVKGEM